MVLAPLSLFGRGAGGEGQTSNDQECLNQPVYCYIAVACLMRTNFGFHAAAVSPHPKSHKGRGTSKTAPDSPLLSWERGWG